MLCRKDKNQAKIFSDFNKVFLNQTFINIKNLNIKYNSIWTITNTNPTLIILYKQIAV